MKYRLLDLLVCPICQQAFEYYEVVDEQEDEIIEGNLVCVNCKQQFPIQGGIPRLAPGHLPQEHRETAGAFGQQWKHFSEMYDAFEKQFLDWIHPIQPHFFKGKSVLDAGCGIGRHIYYAARYEAQEVIGIDLSDAVEVSFENVGKLPNVHIIQADLLKPPFRPDTFDFVYSIGVLHHLPDPEAGFRSLVSIVKPGGKIFTWVYGYEGNAIIRHIIDPLRKKVTSQLPFAVLMTLSFIMTLPLHVAAKLIYRPLSKIGLGFLPYNEYLYQLSGFGFRQNHTIVFDHLVPPISFYIKQEDFENWFVNTGLRDIEISWRNRNSWRGQGVIPDPT